MPAPELAALEPAALAAALRPLWEDAGPLVGLLAGRSFTGWSELIDVAEAQIAAMGPEQQTALLRAHPRLGAPPTALRARSATSYVEQGAGAFPDDGTGRQLEALNDQYEARFGFPCVEWVAGRPLAALVPVIAARMERSRPTELAAGCAALVAIARDRLHRFHGGEPAGG
ncbi:MAG TPA: 2-oxo-4-hydroxy-4-carboxy-5-ureidoimidazoline decarboxylase [Acidimicrobiales bacterium]